jgi:hypothetical protein
MWRRIDIEQRFKRRWRDDTDAGDWSYVGAHDGFGDDRRDAEIYADGDQR